MTLGEKIKNARESCLMTRSEASGRLGLDESDLWRIEKGERMPTYDTLGRMIELLKLDPREIFAEDYAAGKKDTPALALAFRELSLTLHEIVSLLSIMAEMHEAKA